MEYGLYCTRCENVCLLAQNNVYLCFQDFADFLKAANLKTEQEIEELLGVTPNEYVNDLNEPNKKSYLQEWELAFITLKTGPKAIEALAGRNVTKFPKAEVDNAKYDHPNDGWNFAFEVLHTYGNKTKESRKVLYYTYIFISNQWDDGF